MIQSWWHQVCEEQQNIRVPSVRPPTVAVSYSTSTGRSRPDTKMTRQPLTRQEAARIIQTTWRKHVVSGSNLASPGFHYKKVGIQSVHLFSCNLIIFNESGYASISLLQRFDQFQVPWRSCSAAAMYQSQRGQSSD